MKRPATRKIVERTTTEAPPREHLKLDCGHTVTRAIRPGTRRRVVCPDCPA